MRSKDPELMKKIKRFIEECFEESHRMPTVRETAKEMGVAPSCIHRYLVEMADKGMITYSSGRLSTDKIDKMKLSTNNAPLIGSIPCGTPDEREAYVEGYMPLPVSIFGTGSLYILRANGDSMTDAGIDDGDLVVIKEQNHASIGDIVAVLDGESRNTLKTLGFDYDKGCYYLHPENDKYDDIYVKELTIQGVAKHVIKAL